MDSTSDLIWLGTSHMVWLAVFSGVGLVALSLKALFGSFSIQRQKDAAEAAADKIHATSSSTGTGTGTGSDRDKIHSAHTAPWDISTDFF